MLFGGCDIASDEGPCFPSKVFRRLVLPRLQRVVEECHKYGICFLYGSDGNLWPIADDLFGRSGIDGYYEIDRRAGMDLNKLRKRFSNFVLIGNISSYTLHFGTRDEVIAETLSCLREAKESRGIIVGVSNYIVPGTPKENIKALIETIKKYRRGLTTQRSNFLTSYFILWKIAYFLIVTLSLQILRFKRGGKGIG